MFDRVIFPPSIHWQTQENKLQSPLLPIFITVLKYVTFANFRHINYRINAAITMERNSDLNDNRV